MNQIAKQEGDEMILEILESFCRVCDGKFYEFANDEREYCPYCNSAMTEDNISVNETLEVEIEIDFKTGKVTA